MDYTTLYTETNTRSSNNYKFPGLKYDFLLDLNYDFLIPQNLKNFSWLSNYQFPNQETINQNIPNYEPVVDLNNQFSNTPNQEINQLKISPGYNKPITFEDYRTPDDIAQEIISGTSYFKNNQLNTSNSKYDYNTKNLDFNFSGLGESKRTLSNYYDKLNDNNLNDKSKSLYSDLAILEEDRLNDERGKLFDERITTYKQNRPDLTEEIDNISKKDIINNMNSLGEDEALKDLNEKYSVIKGSNDTSSGGGLSDTQISGLVQTSVVAATTLNEAAATDIEGYKKNENNSNIWAGYTGTVNKMDDATGGHFTLVDQMLGRDKETRKKNKEARSMDIKLGQVNNNVLNMRNATQDPHYALNRYLSLQGPSYISAVAAKQGAKLLVQEESINDTWVFLEAPEDYINKFQKGGSVNLIPEGALHARKHNIPVEDITNKGIPVISESPTGEIQLHAEIEKNEIIFRLEVTQLIEEAQKKYESEDTKQSEKDQIAIEIGKLLTNEILYNTDDKTNLIIQE